MINSKRLIQLAKKWQKLAAIKRLRISFPESGASQKSSVPKNSKRLAQLAKKWQKMAAIKRRRFSFPRSGAAQKSSVAKGHFVVYTADNIRFTIPLEYLSTSIFRELLRMSEDEFGLPSDGPITLPCDSTFLNYVVSLVKGCIPEDLEKALLTSLLTCRFSASSSVVLGQSHQQILIYSY